MSYTRKQYLDHECSHREYYGQFVTPSIKNALLQFVGLPALLKSTDPYLNDIPLKVWDTLSGTLRGQLVVRGEYANGVCILKEASRQIIEQETARANT